MVAEVVRAWRPSWILPEQREGCVSATVEPVPRATWRMVAGALRGERSPRWTEARHLRLDGPRANDVTLELLAEAGFLDRIEQLELASDRFSARGIERALRLPAVTTLRIEGATAVEIRGAAAPALRRLELSGCSVETCRAALAAAGGVSAVHLDSLDRARDYSSVWDAMGNRALASVHIMFTQLTESGLAVALRGSAGTLESLVLDGVTGVEGDGFLAGQDWPLLRTLEWRRSKVGRLGAHVPPTLDTLSVRDSSVATLELDGRWPENLAAIDCVGSAASDLLVARLGDRVGQLRRLGLAASELAAGIVAALAQDPSVAMEALDLGDGVDHGPAWRPGKPAIDGVPASLESLSVSGAWALADEVLADVVRGDRVDGLRDLRLHGVGIGDPELAGRVSPRLRRLRLVRCRGYLEGIGAASDALALQELTLDGVSVRDDELLSVLSRSERLVSLRLEHLVGLEPAGLAAALAEVAPRLVQLVLRQFPPDGSPAYGDAIAHASFPCLAEIVLDSSTFSPSAFSHLVDVGITPSLERLRLDCAASDEEWLALIGRPPSALHWVSVLYAGPTEALEALLRDEGSGVADACFYLARGGGL